jgi:hypothetical protein
MAKLQRFLLVVDAAVNLILGLALIMTPRGVTRLICLPTAETYFYGVVLGAVLVGIGVALLVSLAYRDGLGLRGAFAINFCGAAAVAAWLVVSPDTFCPRGLAILWTVVAIVFGLGIVELSERS